MAELIDVDFVLSPHFLHTLGNIRQEMGIGHGLRAAESILVNHLVYSDKDLLRAKEYIIAVLAHGESALAVAQEITDVPPNETGH